MGLFSWGRKKEKTGTEKEKEALKETVADAAVNTVLEAKPSKPLDAAETGSYIGDLTEQLKETQRQLKEAKVEYEAVTSYLTDTQKIDLVPEEERKDFSEAAEKIILFKGERQRYKAQEIKLSERHRHSMEQYEDSVPQELKKMKENEQYQSIIKNDMRHLEGEKGVLLYEREEIVEKQVYLKKLAATAAALVAVLLVLLVALASAFETEMTIPFLLTVIMGVASAFYIVAESRKNQRNMILTEKKLSRAIGLLNKVKIKYINNASCLEYAYEKLAVESSMELEYVWKQYLLLKERDRQFRSTTDKINQYNQVLISELKKYGIADAEVWTYQPEALVDKKEMVEVRHRLNVRRQKLRDRLDYNKNTQEQALTELQKIKKEWPEYGDEINRLFREFSLDEG